MLSQPAKQPMKLGLLFFAESTKHSGHLLRVNGQDSLDELPPFGGKPDQFGALVHGGMISENHAGTLQTIDGTGHTGWPNEQTVAQIGQTKPRLAFLFGTVQSPEQSPLRAANPEPGEIMLH